MIAGLKLPSLHSLILDRSTRQDKAAGLAKYFVASRNIHNYWAIKLLAVDFMYLANVLGNIYFMDIFLKGEFRNYGLDVLNYLNYDPEDRIDPMTSVFPTLTKCSFRQYGPSGTIALEDVLCVLPINIVNQRMFVFLWFWLVILSTVTIIGMLANLAVTFSPVAFAKYKIRTWKNMSPTDWTKLDKDLQLEFGDWKLLIAIANNMEPRFFNDFIQDLINKGRAMKTGDLALKPLARSRTSTIGSQRNLPYKRSGSNLKV